MCLRTRYSSPRPITFQAIASPNHFHFSRSTRVRWRSAVHRLDVNTSADDTWTRLPFNPLVQRDGRRFAKVTYFFLFLFSFNQPVVSEQCEFLFLFLDHPRIEFLPPIDFRVENSARPFQIRFVLSRDRKAGMVERGRQIDRVPRGEASVHLPLHEIHAYGLSA